MCKKVAVLGLRAKVRRERENFQYFCREREGKILHQLFKKFVIFSIRQNFHRILEEIIIKYALYQVLCYTKQNSIGQGNNPKFIFC